MPRIDIEQTRGFISSHLKRGTTRGPAVCVDGRTLAKDERLIARGGADHGFTQDFLTVAALERLPYHPEEIAYNVHRSIANRRGSYRLHDDSLSIAERLKEGRKMEDKLGCKYAGIGLDPQLASEMRLDSDLARRAFSYVLSTNPTEVSILEEEENHQEGAILQIKGDLVVPHQADGLMFFKHTIDRDDEELFTLATQINMPGITFGDLKSARDNNLAVTLKHIPGALDLPVYSVFEYKGDVIIEEAEKVVATIEQPFR